MFIFIEMSGAKLKMQAGSNKWLGIKAYKIQECKTFAKLLPLVNMIWLIIWCENEEESDDIWDWFFIWYAFPPDIACIQLRSNWAAIAYILMTRFCSKATNYSNLNK